MPTAPKPALVIGNGPSVDLLDPEVFQHFETYGCNHIYKKFEAWRRQTDHVLITDSKRVPEIGKNYLDFKGRLHVGNEHYHIPPYSHTRGLLGRDFEPLHQLLKPKFRNVPVVKHVYWPERVCGLIFDKSRCSIDRKEGFNFGQSVTISAIQLAVSHGHRVVCMTGVDSTYPKDKPYFGAMQSAIRYVNPVFTRNPRLYMEPILVLLQIYMEEWDSQLIDCTPGGHLKFVAKGTLTTEAPGYRILSVYNGRSRRSDGA